MKSLTKVEISSITGAKSVDLDAGYIRNKAHAQGLCPSVCSDAEMDWKGQWTTTVSGVMSVCGCHYD